MLKRWGEFFEGENQRLSMHRLLAFMAFIPATAIALNVGNENALGVYLGAFVVNSIGNKAFDVMGRQKGRKNAADTDKNSAVAG